MKFFFVDFLVLLLLLSVTTPFVECHPSLAASARSFNRRVPGITDVLSQIQPDGTSSRIRSLLSTSPAPSVVIVTDFGAVGDGVFDNTASFALAVAAVSSGGIVFVPAGLFSFGANTAVVCNGTKTITASICLTEGVSLVGTYETVPAHGLNRGPTPGDGSTLLPRAGRGNDTGPNFIYIPTDSTIRGFTIWYPEQLNSEAPQPYPYTVLMRGDNAAVTDVELLNSYNGISADGAPRHYIARVQGQPTNVGIFVDQTYDIGRIEDVHWNPWFSVTPAYVAHQTTQGVGFLIARTDWEYVLNTFVFAMSIGYRFIDSAEGSCNGNFVGIGADACQNASVQVDAADPWGIAIVNGEFTSFTGGFGPDVGGHTQIVVSGSNAGAVRFVSSAFWGPSNQIALINGTGSVGFESCLFNNWDVKNEGRAAINVFGGDILVRGSDFQTPHSGGQVLLGANVGKAIIAHNIIKGHLNVTDLGAKVPIIKDNAADGP